MKVFLFEIQLNTTAKLISGTVYPYKKYGQLRTSEKRVLTTPISAKTEIEAITKGFEMYLGTNFTNYSIKEF